jgi:hypothetical protein
VVARTLWRVKRTHACYARNISDKPVFLSMNPAGALKQADELKWPLSDSQSNDKFRLCAATHAR